MSSESGGCLLYRHTRGFRGFQGPKASVRRSASLGARSIGRRDGASVRRMEQGVEDASTIKYLSHVLEYLIVPWRVEVSWSLPVQYSNIVYSEHVCHTYKLRWPTFQRSTPSVAPSPLRRHRHLREQLPSLCGVGSPKPWPSGRKRIMAWYRRRLLWNGLDI